MLNFCSEKCATNFHSGWFFFCFWSEPGKNNFCPRLGWIWWNWNFCYSEIVKKNFAPQKQNSRYATDWAPCLAQSLFTLLSGTAARGGLKERDSEEERKRMRNHAFGSLHFWRRDSHLSYFESFFLKIFNAGGNRERLSKHLYGRAARLILSGILEFGK